MKVSLLRTWILCSLISATNAEANEHPDESAFTATYLYQLAKFINWPNIDPMQHNPLYLCAFDSDPANDDLQKIHLRQVQGREIKVHYLKEHAEFSTCDILFLHRKISNAFVKKHYDSLSKNKILTIGKRDSFANHGGIIQFSLKENLLDVEINFQAAKDANIQINANLIEIASKVYYQRQS